MRLSDIAKIPTTVNKVHESVYRSYHILNKVADLLHKGTPAQVVLELIAEMQDMPHVDVTWEQMVAQQETKHDG